MVALLKGNIALKGCLNDTPQAITTQVFHNRFGWEPPQDQVRREVFASSSTYLPSQPLHESVPI